MAACRSEWGLMCRGMPGGLRDAGDHPVDVASVDRLAGDRPQHERPGRALAAAGLERPEDGDGHGHGGGLVALADQVQDAVAAEGVGVVLDPHGCGFGGAEGVDAEQVGEGAVVDGEGLGDLEEPDQLEPVQALGAGLVAVDLRQSCVDGWVGGDEAVDVGEAEVAADGVHHRVDRGVHQARGRRGCGCRARRGLAGSRSGRRARCVSHQANHSRSWKA